MITQGPGSSKTGRPRGRRAAPKVPCDDCIARATEKEEKSSIELCESCTATLHRPRRKQQEQPNVKRVRRQSKAIIDTALGMHTDPVTLPRSNNQQEQHSVQFFFKHSSSQLAGYFDSPFWQRTVLQAGQHEPAVRHAIAAIGALHEKLLTKTANSQCQEQRTQFALEQCNKSIQLLVKPHGTKTKPDIQLMLTTCVLFTCFEALQGHCEQAIIHATQGYSLLQQYAMDPENSRWEVGAFAVELDQLCILMRRLHNQANGLMGMDFNLLLNAEAITAARPSVFTSLQEAESGLELVLNQLTLFFLDMELDDDFYNLAISSNERNLLFGPWLQDWEKAFTSFLSQNQSTLRKEDRRAAMILKAHHLVAEIFSNVDLALHELGWDAFHDKFAAIVNLATVVLENGTEEDTSIIKARWKTDGSSISTQMATVSFSLGIVDPLYEVCARCRDPKLRRQALSLLAKHPRQECVWSSWSAWKVGKFLMRLEESRVQPSPEHKLEKTAEQRFSETWLDLSGASIEPMQKGEVSYTREIPRATARHALNPGLLEGLDTVGMDFEHHIDPSFAILGTPVSNSASPHNTTAVENSNALAAAGSMPEDFGTPSWIDFEGLEQFTDIPLIRETPPQD